MRASVPGALVESNGGNGAGGRGRELDAEFHCVRIIIGQDGRGIRRLEQADTRDRWRCNDAQRHRRRGRSAVAVGDRVGEAGGARVSAGRREGDGAAIERDRAVRRRRDAGHGQRVAVRIGVVGKQRRCSQRQRRVLRRREAAVGNGDRWLIGPPAAAGLEDDINPVVLILIGELRECARRTVAIDAAANVDGQRTEGVRATEIPAGGGIEATCGIGRHICGVRVDFDRSVQRNALPTDIGFVGRYAGGQERARRRPQMNRMGTDVERSLVETNRRNGARGRRPEPYAHL